MAKNTTVLMVATLDTKKEEAHFLKSCIEECGVQVLILDASIRRTEDEEVEISPDDIAAAAETRIEEVRDLGHEGKALAAMIKGALICTKKLFAEKNLNGIIAIGGSMGTTLGTALMRELDFGLPKVMISTMAAGFVKPFVGTKDILMLHSVADLSGLNTITRSALRNGAYALAGMAQKYQKVEKSSAPTIVMSTLGTIDACANIIKNELRESGYEVIVFHTNGTGGAAMDDVINEKNVVAVLDLSLIEVSDYLFNGLYAGTSQRGRAALEKRIPTIFAPGNLDFVVAGPLDDAEKRFPGKTYHRHNAAVTAVRTGRQELETIVKHFGKMFTELNCPTQFLVPLKGFSSHDSVTGHLHDPSMPPVFERLLHEHCPAETPITALPYHFNDPEFAEAIINSVKSALAG